MAVHVVCERAHTSIRQGSNADVVPGGGPPNSMFHASMPIIDGG